MTGVLNHEQQLLDAILYNSDSFSPLSFTGLLVCILFVIKDCFYLFEGGEGGERESKHRIRGRGRGRDRGKIGLSTEEGTRCGA